MVLFLELKAGIQTHRIVNYTDKALRHTGMWQHDFDLAVREVRRLINPLSL